VLATWREAGVFDAREQAALAFAEQSRTSALPVFQGPVWDAAAAHFDEQELTALIVGCASINAGNRLNVAIRILGSAYRSRVSASGHLNGQRTSRDKGDVRGGQRREHRCRAPDPG
jgi:hypothetical protein